MKPGSKFAVAFAVALVVGGSLVVVALSRPPSGAASPEGPQGPIVPATLTISPRSHSIPSTFYGVGIQLGTSLSSDSPSLLRSTPIVSLRYPDGSEGDATDLVNNTIYAPGYVNTTSSRVTLPEFIATCRAINCSAIVILPLEIDEPGTAAYEVRYIEDTLDFTPAYWELGNEPGGWTCFGTPWVDWATGCTGGTNATEYAAEVARYIAAIRPIDPDARFLGLGGTDGPEWITPLEEEDGPQLAGISLHSYVDDLLPSTSDLSLSNFFAGLSASNSLPNLIATSRAAILAACSSCSTVIYFTEMESVSLGQPLATYLPTFYNAVFFAAEMIQGLNSPATSIEPFTWESDVDGLITSQGPAPRYVVESTFLSRLGSIVAPANVSFPGVYATYATTGSGGTEMLLVNTNVTDRVNVTLPEGSFGTSLPIDEWSWSSGDAAPVESGVSNAASVLVPPLSIVLLDQ